MQELIEEEEILQEDSFGMATSPKEPKVVVGGPWAWLATSLGIPPWGQILILLLIGQAIFIFSMHTDLSEIKGTLKSIPLSVAHDLLSQANEDVSAQNVPRAFQAIDSAQSLLIRSKVKGVPAKDENFQQLVVDLNLLSRSSPALAEKVNGTRIVLANYRSALEPQPRMQKEQAHVDKTYEISVQAATVDKSRLPGSVLIAVPTEKPFNFLESPFFRVLSTAPSINDVGFMSGNQILDGFHWNRDVFVNTVIHYDGGEVELNNTRFVNCTFQMSDNPRSDKIATYVTLEQTYLKIGPGD
jgi:hypothetical protein